MNNTNTVTKVKFKSGSQKPSKSDRKRHKALRKVRRDKSLLWQAV